MGVSKRDFNGTARTSWKYLPQGDFQVLQYKLKEPCYSEEVTLVQGI